MAEELRERILKYDNQTVPGMHGETAGILSFPVTEFKEVSGLVSSNGGAFRCWMRVVNAHAPARRHIIVGLGRDWSGALVPMSSQSEV